MGGCFVDINQLVYFKAVAETLNFTRAASNLYMSQTTLSYQISSLEKEIGVKLFNRGHAGVTLTPAGEKLLEYAPHIIREVELAVDATTKSGLGVSSTLHVGLLGTHEHHFIAPLVTEFGIANPDVDVCLHIGSPARVEQGVKDGSLDLAFTIAMDPIEDDDLSCVFFERLPFYAIMRKDNEFAKRDSIERRELKDQRLCFMRSKESPELNNHFLNSFGEDVADSLSVDVSATMESAMILIESKGYVTIAPKCLMQGYEGSLVAVPMAGDGEFVNHGIIRRKGSTNPFIDLFIDAARELMERRAAAGEQFADYIL